MDPLDAAVREQGNKASESTTEEAENKFQRWTKWPLNRDWRFVGCGEGLRKEIGRDREEVCALLGGEFGRRRILWRRRRIFIVLEMRHLLGTMLEKAAWLLLE